MAAFVVSCEVQDFGEILETAGDEIRWYSVVRHAGVSLPLEIPADGSFTEPRNANMITIVAELPEPVDPASISAANIDFIGRDNADAVRTRPSLSAWTRLTRRCALPCSALPISRATGYG